MQLNYDLFLRIEKLIEAYNRKNDDIFLSVTKSKTTNSIYIQATNTLHSLNIFSKFRLSDHRNSKVKTKIICKCTNFDYIIRRIDTILRQIRNKRYYMLFNYTMMPSHSIMNRPH